MLFSACWINFLTMLPPTLPASFEDKSPLYPCFKLTPTSLATSYLNFSKSIDIQFAPGLEIFNDKIYITFAIGDCIPFELSFDIDLLDDLFNNKNSLDKIINKDEFTVFLTNPKINIQEYSNIFNNLGNLSASVFIKSMI